MSYRTDNENQLSLQPCDGDVTCGNFLDTLDNIDLLIVLIILLTIVIVLLSLW